VYWRFVNTLATALQQGLTHYSESMLCAIIPKQTLYRWLKWWRNHNPVNRRLQGILPGCSTWPLNLIDDLSQLDHDFLKRLVLMLNIDSDLLDYLVRAIFTQNL